MTFCCLTSIVDENGIRYPFTTDHNSSLAGRKNKTALSQRLLQSATTAKPTRMKFDSMSGTREQAKMLILENGRRYSASCLHRL